MFKRPVFHVVDHGSRPYHQNLKLTREKKRFRVVSWHGLASPNSLKCRTRAEYCRSSQTQVWGRYRHCPRARQSDYSLSHWVLHAKLPSRSRPIELTLSASFSQELPGRLYLTPTVPVLQSSSPPSGSGARFSIWIQFAMWGQPVSPPEVGSAPKSATLWPEKGPSVYVSASTTTPPPLWHSIWKRDTGTQSLPARVILDPRPKRRNLPLPTAACRRHHGNVAKNGDNATQWNRMNL